MICVAISFLLVVVLCVYTFAALSRPPDTTTNADIYRVDRGLVTGIGLCGVFWIVFTGVYIVALWGDRSQTGRVWYMVAFIGIILANLAGYAFMARTHVLIANGVLISRMPPRTTETPLSDMRKIIIYTGSSASAKIARLYAMRSTTLSGLLSGYDELVERIVASCPNAEVITKPRNRWHALKPRYQHILFGASLPFFLLAIVFFVYAAVRLGRVFRIPLHLQLTSQDGFLWTVCFLAIFLLLILLSAFLTRLAIAVALYAAGRIGLREVSGLVFRSRYPKHWYTHNGETKPVT